MVHAFFRQVELINGAIDKAKKGSYLHGLPHVADPSEEVQEVLIACVEWNMETRAKDIPEADLPALQQKAVDLLDLLKRNLPDKTGEKARWNFEKAHSILHKVREIVLWGNTDNTSCQSPEVRTYQYVLNCIEYVLFCTSMYLDELMLNHDYSMPTSRTSSLWPTCQTTKMSSCVFCASMPEQVTFNTIRPC